MREKNKDSAVTREECASVMGACCHIALSNGAEAFFINGWLISDERDEAREGRVLELARRVAGASGQVLNCYVLPVPQAGTGTGTKSPAISFCRRAAARRRRWIPRFTERPVQAG